MGYVDQLLAPGEQVLLRTRRHPLVLLRAATPALIGAAGLILLGYSLLLQPTNQARMVGIGGGLLAFGIGVALLLPPLLRWRNEEYLITDRRVIQSEGVLHKRVLDSSLNKINDVLLTQSLLGRLLDFGTLEILTASEVGINRLDWMPRPLRFKRAMLDAKGMQGAEQAAPAAGPRTVAQQLAELDQLKQQGLVTEAEYKLKRAEILARI
jgi:uncharacterized membrane protein YdbT with pleckstrin-like domain